MSSWKSPGAASSAVLTLSHLEHRFSLLVIVWHLWITVMLSYSQLQSSWWEGSQLLEALAMKKKKTDFSIIHWKCYLWKHLLQFWEAGNNLGNAQSCSLEGMFLHTEQRRTSNYWKPWVKWTARNPEGSNYPSFTWILSIVTAN